MRATKPHLDYVHQEVLKDESLKKLQETVSLLKEKYDLTTEEVIAYAERKKKVIEIPVSIYDNDHLSALESTTKYLKENLDLRFSEIARLLNRDDRTIWDAYDKSQKKMQEEFHETASRYSIPLSIISDRNVAVLESITEYLKDEFSLKYSEIAILLNRNQRTIWTVYQRAKKKRKQ